MIIYKKDEIEEYPQIKRVCSYFERFFNKNDLFTPKKNGLARFFIVGGCIRDYFDKGYVSSDIDIMFSSEKGFNEVKNRFTKKYGKPFFEGENGEKYKQDGKTLDLIHRDYYGTVDEAIANFDFTICVVGMEVTIIDDYKCEVDKFAHHPTFFMDLATKRLLVQSLPAPLSTLKRLQKYNKKGYSICEGGLIQIANAINGLDMSDPEQNELEYYPDGEERIKMID